MILIKSHNDNLPIVRHDIKDPAIQKESYIKR